MEPEILQSAVESIFFASDRPVSLAKLKEVFGEEGPAEELLSEIVAKVQEKFSAPHHGFELRQAQGGYHFVTKMENADYIRKYHESKPFRVGRSALEVLSIIAYRQPITRAEIDQVRGIDSSHLLRTLIERGLIKMGGKAEIPGRPVQYGTTARFLEVVGLADVAGLPPLIELDQLQGNTEDPMKKLEEGLNRFMTSDTRPEEAAEETDSQLAEIESMISGADGGTKEIFESPTHAEVAEENILALAAFQEFLKPRRKNRNVVKYEDLAGAEVPLDGNSTPAPDVVN